MLNVGVPLANAWEKAGLTVSFDPTKNASDVRAFFMDRLRQLFTTQRLRHDIVDAVTDTATNDIANVIASAYALDARKDKKDFKDQIEALTRVMRIAKKADSKTPTTVDSQKFENPSEGTLAAKVADIAKQFDSKTPAENLDALLGLEPVISQYFEENMVMAKDLAVRANRLAQLRILANLISHIGNLDQLVVK